MGYLLLSWYLVFNFRFKSQETHYVSTDTNRYMHIKYLCSKHIAHNWYSLQEDKYITTSTVRMAAVTATATYTAMDWLWIDSEQARRRGTHACCTEFKVLNSRCSDWVTGWSIRSLIPRQGKESFLFPKTSRPVIGPIQPPIQGYRGSFPVDESVGVWNWQLSST